MMLISFNSFACDCECKGDCSFSSVMNGMEFVALIRVIEYTDYVKIYTNSTPKEMPLSMVVELIKKYKGKESRERIKIWGDDGMLCRPYVKYFNIDSYYLIAPQKIEKDSEIGGKGDYEFFTCWNDYLEVDFEKQVAYGKYSKRKRKISLEKFEKQFQK